MKKATLLHTYLLRQVGLLVACLTALIISGMPAFAQTGAVPCPPNIDWENGDFSNWNYFTGNVQTGQNGAPSPRVNTWNPTPAPGPNVAIENNPATTDLYGGFPVVAPGGGGNSLRIGNTGTGGDGDMVRYFIHVPAGSNDYSFAFKYAAVLNDVGHQPWEQPTFQVRAFDSATGQPVPCANLIFVANGALPGFFTSPLQANGAPVRYCDWTGGALPIIGQGGKTIIIEVIAMGCSLGGHFGYAYFDVTSCGTYKAAVSYCNLDSGFVRIMGTGINQIYNWYTSNWNYVGQGFYVDAPVPATPDFFWGVLASGSPGCLDTIRTDTISDFQLNAVPAKTCVAFGTPLQLDAQTTGGIGGFEYSWDADPEISDVTIKNPTANPNDTTRYFVTVSDKIGCFRRDTVVVAEAPNAGPDVPVCPLGDRPAQLRVFGPQGVQYQWYEADGSTPALYLSCTDCDRPVAAPVDPVHTYRVGYEGCAVLDEIVVYHDTSNKIEAPQDPLLVCRPSFVQLQSVTYGPNPRQNYPCGTTNLITCNPADQETVTVGYGVIPPKAAFNTPLFSERNFVKYQFLIPKAEIFRSGFYSGTINAMSLRVLNTTLLGGADIDQMAISLACTEDTNYALTPTNASFITGLTTVANVSGLALTPDSWNKIDFSQGYNWDTSKNLVVDICLTMVTRNAAGTGIEPIAMVPGEAIQKFDDAVNVCGGNAPAGNIRRYFQRPSVQFTTCPTPELPFDFTWRPGGLLSDSTEQNPRLFVQESMDLTVYSVGRNGCQMRDELHIIHPDHELDLQPQDTFICKGQPAYMRASGGLDGYQWYEFNNGVFSDGSGSLSCLDCPNPTATPVQTTTYAVVYSNDIGVANPNNDNYATGCPDTLFTTVNVRELPNVWINSRDTLIKFGQSVPLYANGASHYVWTPSGSLSDPNSPAPVASPAQTTNYIVVGTDSSGCTARDTVTVTIDYHNNLLVPTAFTPNGDGLNDEFKVVNATFQRLMEFRVFNRWGQEVFSTTDIRRGWDGRWKGVDQPMGAYNYLIRVAIPDGNTEMYKGDVTLIR